ncbi:RNA-directed DNA polymerase (Reverse transcriptase), Ribonuclease H [Hibiscus syriacus]|uniref:RNA-directed DNA polymerase (Reverse transcriptase), Ribonuclease H n=1 Tax=Hibiscus syriacus TaxID=106335 RepID=A0A6A3AD55_HIBSY|nr:RNA-directed DNA polymerase (Reverse transcriptase), Ribonuclease H [Hibiscus syriacus]
MSGLDTEVCIFTAYEVFAFTADESPCSPGKIPGGITTCRVVSTLIVVVYLFFQLPLQLQQSQIRVQVQVQEEEDEEHQQPPQRHWPKQNPKQSDDCCRQQKQQDKPTATTGITVALGQDVMNLEKHMNDVFGAKWKEELCEGKLIERKIEAGSSAVLVVAPSALRSIELLRGMRSLTKECCVVKLFSKQMKIDEQLQPPLFSQPLDQTLIQRSKDLQIQTLGYDTLGPRPSRRFCYLHRHVPRRSAAATKPPEKLKRTVHVEGYGRSLRLGCFCIFQPPWVVAGGGVGAEYGYQLVAGQPLFEASYRIKGIYPRVNRLIGKPSSMDEKCLNQIVPNSEVRQWAEDLQRQGGDSLQDDFVSELVSYAPVSLKRNDMQDLRGIWESWDSNKKLQFYQTYGDIPYLLYVEVDDDLLRALIPFWNPGYNCFTLNKEDLVPTIEEYTTLLHIEGALENRIYSSEGIAWTNIKELIQSHPNDKVRFDLFALIMYGMVIFSKVLGYIEAPIIDLFDQLPKRVNPASAILAETFRSLNACRKLGGGRFSGCAQLLYVWIRSHFWRTEKVSYRRFNTDYSPLKEFLEQEWPKEITKDMQINAFRNLQSDDIVWRTPWKIQREFFYKCGDYNWVMLLGLWGRIGYALLLVIRQYEGRQFVPVTTGLHSGQRIEEFDVEKAKWELERRNLNTRLEKLSQRTQEARTKLEEDLDQSRNKNSEFNAYILQLEESLFQEKVHLGPSDLKESNKESASLRRRIRDLEKTLHNCQVRITELEQTLEGTNEQWQKSTNFYVERSEERSNMVFEAMVQMSEVARYVGELAVEAKIIEHHVDPVSKYGKKMTWLIKEIIELNRKATPQATKKIMEDKIQRIEEQHNKEQAEMRMKLEKIEASIVNSQDSMMQKIEDMFKKQATIGKIHENPVSFDQEPMYPLGFPPEPIYHSGITLIQIHARTSALQEAKPHENQQVDLASSSKNTLISDVKIGNFNAEHLIPDLNELNEKEKVNEELTRQIRSLEERIKSVEITESFYGFDASELSLVPDLILPIKFKVPEFERYDGTTCPSSHITMFCRRMAGHVKDEKLLIHCFQDSLTGPTLKLYTQLTKDNIRSWKDLAKAFLEQYRHVTDMGTSSKRPMYRKKENEVNNANSYNKDTSKSITITQPRVKKEETNTNRVESRGSQRESERLSFTPLPVPYAEMYDSLLKVDVIRPYPLVPMQPPFPPWYDVKAHCVYHEGIMGHSIENYLAFKRVVQNLINTGKLEFNSPATSNHPLPNHGDKNVNAIQEENRKKAKTDVSEIKYPFGWIFQQLSLSGMIPQEFRPKYNEGKNYYEYHQEKGHEIQLCPEFRDLVQKLMNNNEIELFEQEPGKREDNVCSSEDSKPNQRTSDPVIINVKSSIVNHAPTKPKVVITTPLPFPHKDTRRVPWNYTTNVSMVGGSVSLEKIEEKIQSVDSTSKEVSKVGFFTRSGRCYSPETSNALEQVKAKGKAMVIPQKVFDNESPPAFNELVIETQAQEFLKFLKHNISLNKLDRIVGHIAADNYITFMDDEIPEGGMRSIKVLNITTHFHGHVLPVVFIDNGSALNLMPLVTLQRMPVDKSHMKSYQNVVRAFDGTQKEVLGKMPWIHSAGAVPSSLHQKLKFVVDGQLICVGAEEEIIASITSDVLYIETNDDALECSFRAFEFVNATFIAEGSKIPHSRLSDCTKMTVRQTLGIGAKIGKGLGKNLQGSLVPLKTTFRSEGTVNVEQQLVEAFKEEKLTKDQRIVEEAMEGLFINMIMNDNKTGKYLAKIRPCFPGETLNNWNVEDLLVVFNINTECHNVNSMLIPKFNREINLEEPICLEEINECEDELEYEEMKEVKIGTTLTIQIKQELINLLLEFKDIFAWSYQDMPGLSTDIVMHKLPISPKYKPVQQKLRRMRPEMLLQIKEEVIKQINADFLQAAKYPEWVANNVPVPKKNGKVRMCVDYRDLNKANPKYSFPLPHIDTLVDNTAGHAWFSFMDDFSGYNQIKINPEDMEKTTFVTMWGTFCYKVMPFGLKNVGATNQRAMVTLFHDMMHKETLDIIKKYLSNAPILVSPMPDRPLILYLTVFENSMGCVLGQHDKSGRKEKAIYYLSKKFTDYEIRYPPIQKLCCALVWATRRLRQYMLYHTTWLISKLDPLKFLMESPAFTGRMARWQMLLSEFDIVYVNQKAIKGSVIADFLASRVSDNY